MYIPAIWADFIAGGTPINAAALQHLEQGVSDADVTNPASPARAVVVPRWVTATAYAAGDKVVSPNGDIVKAIAAHTSGVTFTPANWNLSLTYSALGDVTPGSTMHKGELAANIAVSLTGHSLMYGMDTTAAGTNPGVNGSTLTRSATPTPERFDLMTDYLSAGAVDIVNQAYPGDRSTEALTRWVAGTSSDLEIFWCDTNDGLSSGAGPALTDAQTSANMRDFIKRARARGADVIVVGGVPGVVDSDHRKIFASAQAERTVAERMGARYVDVGELLTALPKSLTFNSSGVHLQKEGYNLVGTRLAALTGPKGINPPKVGPGRVFTPRDGLHTLRSPAAIVARGGAADTTVWGLGVLGTLGLCVDVVQPCIPLIRARVIGTTEGFGVVGIYHETGGSGRSNRFVKIAASSSQTAAGYVYFLGAPLMSPGPASVVLRGESGQVEIDSIEFLPIPQGFYSVGDPTFDQKRTKKISLTPVGGASAGRANASWDAMFDTASGVATATGSTGATNVDTRWLFDLNLGPNTSGVVLAQSLYSAPASSFWGFAQGYMFIRSGTSLLARKLDNGVPTDVTFASAFASATGNIRCAIEIYYDPAGDTFTVYLDGTSLGTVAAPAWKFYTAGLVAGAAASGGYAAGSGVVIQKASAII